MPPSQIQHGFSPFFKGSLSYEDSRKNLKRNKFESSVAAQQEEADLRQAEVDLPLPALQPVAPRTAKSVSV